MRKRFRVTYVTLKASKNDTHKVLLNPLGAVGQLEGRDPSAKPVWVIWLPAEKLVEYTGLFAEAKATNQIFVLEAEVARIQVDDVYHNPETKALSQDLEVKFADKVTKTVEAKAVAAAPVEW